MLSLRVMAANEMETDDHSHLPASNGLRRSNSAPNISVAVCTHNTPTFRSISLPRQRRFSVTLTNQNPIPVSPASRLTQIRRDESIDDMAREVQKENEINTTFHLSHDLGESMHLDNDKHDSPMHERRDSFECTTEMFPSPAPSSPSPTRGGWRTATISARNGRSMTPSPIPSPTRTTVTMPTRRSLSPVCLRPRPPNYGPDLGVSPSKKVYDGPSNSSSLEGPCETAHLNFDDINYLNIDHNISHATNSTSSTTISSVANHQSVSPMMVNDATHRMAFVSPYHRSRFTPPRSPLAGPAISHAHTDNPVPIVTTQSCFTFAPVRD
ncbi:Protein FAM122A [Exaiptasia diaphana]|nr:Protein FAM122A [Exaiptasia diaphana]